MMHADTNNSASKIPGYGRLRIREGDGGQVNSRRDGNDMNKMNG